ncbi:hypothetical protein [Demequina iriomotensis]|uniref:hypothetical protein n=1 Tax=Demequina iriomotensis TaxID=1536641 RepID=UPI000783B8E7|nr:hypothetical protein [Demequina iriomotensis]
MTRDESSWAPIDPPRPGEPADVAPSKPAAPRAASPYLSPVPVPVPVDLDIDDVAAPFAGPEAAEILPEAWSPLDADGAPEERPAAPARTTVEALGAAAAANAALHAAGAPTPLGGVPLVGPRTGAGAGAATATLEDDGPAFVPIFATHPAATRDDAPVVTTTPSGAARTANAAPPAAPAWHAVAAAVDGGGDGTPGPALYRPRVTAAPEGAGGSSSSPTPGARTASAGGGDGPPHHGRHRNGERHPGRAWPLILIGLVILGGAFVAAWYLLLRPEPVTLPEQHILTEPQVTETPAVEAFVPEDPSPFLAAMPTVSGPWTLTGVTTLDAASDNALPDRVAEAHRLTYSDGTSEISVVARQLYSRQDAVAALTRAAGDGTEITEATVAGTDVGKRAEREVDAGTRVMWTNGSAYFEATGSPADVASLLETLGL